MNEESTTEDWFSRGRRWEEEHQAYVEAWLEQQCGNGSEPGYDVGRFAAGCLLRIPEARGEGQAPGIRDREPFAWDAIDAYEILFCHTVHAGFGVFEAEDVLPLMGAFARYLGEQGVIGVVEHTGLQAEWDVWSARLLEVLHDGGWYREDGRRLLLEGCVG